MTQQTAVEWLENKMASFNIHFFKELKAAIEQAKGMEHKEHEKIYNHAFNYGCEFSRIEISDEVLKKTLEDINKQPMTFVHNEISDEEIEKQSKYWNETTNPDMWTFELAWKAGAKWYREQLKKKL